MLPYQVATSGVPYGYTLVPQQVLGPGQRLVPVPGGRNVYSLVDMDDEGRLRSPTSPSSFPSRLSSTRPARATNFWRTYDYDTRSLTPRYLAPPPDRSTIRPITPTLDEEPDQFLQSLRPSGRRGGSRLVTASYSGGAERVYTPTSLTAHRVQSLYKELDEPLYAPELKNFDYTACLRRDRAADQEKVRGVYFGALFCRSLHPDFLTRGKSDHPSSLRDLAMTPTL
ncbi:hypothetical protein Ocin01_16048 [Orchesella cincta]|uniref:Uncharacterized protein n=1 Tax=Orchesella cincta TaxID=48709 RepID=A0A1D2MCM3_ORCCI|nr:hypothetical protein Ocin01_16048 [Orchesella cincta]